MASHPTSSSGPTHAILVAADFDKCDFQEGLSKLALLASTTGSEPVRAVTGKYPRPNTTLFIGAGKAEGVKIAADEKDAEIVIFNHALNPTRQHGLERFLGRHVMDRTGLILDIFSQCAQSHVGKMRVELTRVRYQAARLIWAWSHSERQKGGVSLRGSPGEHQLELDRRILDGRTKCLSSELGKLQRQRDTQRRSRSRNDAFSVSLVGYASADKSTLSNALTETHAYAANRLFATLDTTSRQLYLEGLDNVVLSDTVDFIHDLPTRLVAASRTMLEETVHADVLLHVMDAASTVKHKQMEQVDRVLDEVDASSTPQILVINRIDAVEKLRVTGPCIEHDETEAVRHVFVSAIEGTEFDLLREALIETAIRLREYLASHDGDFDPRFDTRRDLPSAHRDELSQSLSGSGFPAEGDEGG